MAGPYNTGNPVPSTSAEDREDNTAVLDQLINGFASTVKGRLGKQLTSWTGMELQFSEMLVAMGYEVIPLVYTPNTALQVNRPTQLIAYQGSSYRVKLPATFPVVLTGVWATDAPRLSLVTDGCLRNELAASNGVELVGGAIRAVKDVAELRTLSGALNSNVVVMLGANGARLDSSYRYDPTDVTSPDDGGLVIRGVGSTRFKLNFTYTIDLRVFNLASNADATAAINAATLALFAQNGGGELRINTDHTISGIIAMRPHVTIRGAGDGAAPNLTFTGTGAMFETQRPAGWVNNFVIESNVFGFTLVGPGVSSGAEAFSLRQAVRCQVAHNEIALFSYAFRWNKGTVSSTNFEESYFNKIYQNTIRPCGRGHYFQGSANRNTLDTNSIADAAVAYDFSGLYNFSETNTFLNENIEGCRVWAEWSTQVFSHTWVGCTIENPNSNGFVCLIKDPGRQVFLNLGVIPLGDTSAIDFYSINGAKPSAVFGSAASSENNRLGIRLNEQVNVYDSMCYLSHHASQVYTGNIPGSSSVTISIPLPIVKVNYRASAYALRDLLGCTLQAWAEAGSVKVRIVNGTNTAANIQGVEISVLVEQFA